MKLTKDLEDILQAIADLAEGSTILYMRTHVKSESYKFSTTDNADFVDCELPKNLLDDDDVETIDECLREIDEESIEVFVNFDETSFIVTDFHDSVIIELSFDEE